MSLLFRPAARDPVTHARDRRHREPGDVRDHTAVLEIGPRAEGVTGAGEHDHAGFGVEADLPERVAQRNHHVEGHRVLAIGPVQRDLRDVRLGLVDHHERQ